MNIKKLSTILFLGGFFTMSYSETKYVGADVSLLPKYENAGSVYKDINGNKIDDLLAFLYEDGMRVMRVRLFVDPDNFPGKNDGNVPQDLEYITPLCKNLVDHGFEIMLDFHYSDTWADPAKQWIPEAWKDLTEEQLIQKVYDYTSETLQSLKSNGITPAFIQPGNEISYGMLWSPYGAPESEQHKTYMGNSANWDRLGRLLSSAIAACKEECPDAKIVIHTERVAQVNVQNNFYQMMKKLGVDYDIIGLSYYPYFHGQIGVLNTALTSLEENFPDKEIMIVETGYPYAWEVPGTDKPVDYPYTFEGQAQFATDLVNTLDEHPNATGLFWWWLEYNAYNSNLNESWYNAPLFDSRTGKETPALKIICGFGTAGIKGISDHFISKDNKLFNINGLEIVNPKPGDLIIKEGKKVIIRK